MSLPHVLAVGVFSQDSLFSWQCSVLVASVHSFLRIDLEVSEEGRCRLTAKGRAYCECLLSTVAECRFSSWRLGIQLVIQKTSHDPMDNSRHHHNFGIPIGRHQCEKSHLPLPHACEVARMPLLDFSPEIGGFRCARRAGNSLKGVARCPTGLKLWPGLPWILALHPWTGQLWVPTHFCLPSSRKGRRGSFTVALSVRIVATHCTAHEGLNSFRLLNRSAPA